MSVLEIGGIMLKYNSMVLGIGSICVNQELRIGAQEGIYPLVKRSRSNELKNREAGREVSV